VEKGREHVSVAFVFRIHIGCNVLITTRSEAGFGRNVNNGQLTVATKLIPVVLLANLPQIILSFCYLAYNSLFTRMLAAREWAQMSTGYKPLRVTDPKGTQISTFRLQLPYSYAVPLLGLSIVLHWLLSNSIYMLKTGS
jgi:hypothetical protein